MQNSHNKFDSFLIIRNMMFISINKKNNMCTESINTFKLYCDSCFVVIQTLYSRFGYPLQQDNDGGNNPKHYAINTAK